MAKAVDLVQRFRQYVLISHGSHLRSAGAVSSAHRRAVTSPLSHVQKMLTVWLRGVIFRRP